MQPLLQMWSVRTLCVGMPCSNSDAGKRGRVAVKGQSAIHQPMSHQKFSYVRQQGTLERPEVQQSSPPCNQSTDRRVSLSKVSYLAPKNQAKLLDLIGKKCLVHCVLDNVPTVALWDTGAQASLINDGWRKKYLPHTRVRAIEELIGPGTVSGFAVNQTEIPFCGWIEVGFQLKPVKNSGNCLRVPMLVSPDPGVAEEPIIGYNVIEEVIKQRTGAEELALTNEVVNMLSIAFSLKPARAKTLVQVLRNESVEDMDKAVKIGKV